MLVDFLTVFLASLASTLTFELLVACYRVVVRVRIMVGLEFRLRLGMLLVVKGRLGFASKLALKLGRDLG